MDHKDLPYSVQTLSSYKTTECKIGSNLHEKLQQTLIHVKTPQCSHSKKQPSKKKKKEVDL